MHKATKTKQILCGLLAAVLLIFTAILPASAVQTDGYIQLLSQTDTARVGDVIEFRVICSPDTQKGLGALDFALRYDPAALEYLPETLITNGILDPAYHHSPGKFTFSGCHLDGIGVWMTVIKISFRVLNPNTAIDLDITSVGLGDFDSTNVTDSTIENSITRAELHCPHEGTWQVAKPPTHQEDGLEEMICSICGLRLTRPIPRIDHPIADDLFTQISAPNWREDGVKEAVCPTCHEVVRFRIPSYAEGFLWTADKTAVRGYQGPFQKLFLPETIQNNTVTTLASDAFANRTDVTQIVLPDTLTAIESGAFRGCTALQHIHLPHGLRAIPAQAFAGCTALTGLAIPADVMDIAADAFADCTNLQVIVGEAGSYAQEYAGEHGYTFYRLGDANLDGSVDALDRQWMLDYALGAVEASAVQLLTADVNGDNAVDLFDAHAVA